MDVYDQIAVKIIEGQEAIIGPVAIEQAEQVQGLQLDWNNHSAAIAGDKVAAIDELIERYKELFGHISVEVSKESAASVLSQLPTENLPKALR